MVFLFVGSSALTRSFLPTDLTAPQLLRSSACVMLAFVMNASLTAFPHRGLPRLAEALSEGRSPHQFTPMSGAHHGMQRMRASRSGDLQFSRQGRLALTAEAHRWGIEGSNP